MTNERLRNGKQRSLFCFRQRLQVGLVDFQGDAGVAVGDFGDFVLGGDADELGDLGWGEFVVVGEPLGHVAGGVAEGVVEGAGVAEGDDGLWGFDADGGERLLGMRSTVNSTSMEVSRALPLISPSPWRAWPSPR